MAHLSDGIRYQRTDEFVARNIAGETVLVPVHRQIGDLESIYTLNEVATFLWERLADATTPVALALALEETFAGIRGIKGVHCCGNTDWSILLQTSTDIINFDTYNYAESLAIYPNEVKKFLDRGGCIAWGIVPTDAELVAKESVASLKDRLEFALELFIHKGIPFKQLLEQGLITPSCGLGPIGSETAAERALQLTVDLSNMIRKKYL